MAADDRDPVADALRLLAEADAGRDAPPRVEAAVIAAWRARHATSVRHRSPRLDLDIDGEAMAMAMTMTMTARALPSPSARSRLAGGARQWAAALVSAVALGALWGHTTGRAPAPAPDAASIPSAAHRLAAADGATAASVAVAGRAADQARAGRATTAGRAITAAGSSSRPPAVSMRPRHSPRIPTTGDARADDRVAAATTSASAAAVAAGPPSLDVHPTPASASPELPGVRRAPAAEEAAAALAAAAPIEFTPLPYVEPLQPTEMRQIVRMPVPRDAVLKAGLFTRDRTMPASGRVLADVLVGEDGVARGIRLVRER